MLEYNFPLVCTEEIGSSSVPPLRQPGSVDTKIPHPKLCAIYREPTHIPHAFSWKSPPQGAHSGLQFQLQLIQHSGFHMNTYRPPNN